MTTLEETIYPMDWLREHGEIEVACMTNGGEYEHLPEHCREETQDYWEWEHGRRSKGSLANGQTRWLAVLPRMRGKKSTEITGAMEKPFPPNHLEISGITDRSNKM